MTTLYLGGPMTGRPLFNHPAFADGAGRLRAAGHVVFSPAEHDIDLGIDITNAAGDAPLTGRDTPMMRKVLGDDLAWIMANAQGIAVLDGWTCSKGTRAEVSAGLAIGIPIAPVWVWERVRSHTEPTVLEWWTDACASALDGTLRYAVPGMVLA